MNKYKLGIIGCGRISQKHAEIVTKYQKKKFDLTAAVDIDINRAKKFSKKFNVEVYSSIKKLLNNSNLDVIAILTPSGLHPKHAIYCSKFCKNIIVEKPMALDILSAKKMIKECKKNKSRLFIVKQNRFNLPVKKLYQTIQSGRFGKLVLGTIRLRWARHQKYYDLDEWRGTWALDGGVLANQASHHIDLLQYTMGDVKSVYAMTERRLLKIETEDTAIALLRFKNNSLGIIEATTATRPENLEGSISILGEKGTVVIAGKSVNNIETWNFKRKINEDKIIKKKFSENPKDVYGFGHNEFYNHVYDTISKNKYKYIDGSEGIKSLEIIKAIYKSAETKKEVFIK